jgi:AcrR family transcriptional regulator
VSVPAPEPAGAGTPGEGAANGDGATLRKQPASARGRRTRARLIAAAERVFVERGWFETRVADITKAAGVSHGGFYTYFDSKEAIFRDVAAEVVDEVHGVLSEPGFRGLPLQARIPVAGRRYLEVYERYAGILALIEQVATFDEHFRDVRTELRRRFVSRIESVVERINEERGDGDAALDARVTAHALGGMIDHFAHLWFVQREPFDRDVAITTLDRICARALGLPDQP